MRDTSTGNAVGRSRKMSDDPGEEGDNMTIRTLVWEQLQFGLDPSAFRRGAARALARVAGRSREEARVTIEELREDFRLDAARAEALLRALVERRLLEGAADRPDYRLTERFREFALARVVPALDR